MPANGSIAFSALVPTLPEASRGLMANSSTAAAQMAVNGPACARRRRPTAVRREVISSMLNL
jgi:hypothetical protein